MRAVHREIREWLEQLDAHVRIDAAGNLRAVCDAEEANAPRLLIGSHLDTVPNAGAYDGILGVVIAVALLQGLRRRKLPYAIEVVGFSEEEGVRFGIPFIGSRALVGSVDETLLAVNDGRGISIRKAIEDFGLSPRDTDQAQMAKEVCGYVEFHIEQGPVLDKLGLPLAIVDAIVGQSRLELVFLGRSNHAGTTPMNLRYDAMAGAAEWITEVENIGRNTSGLVATVGSVQTKPGAGNVIAGEVRLTLDVRHRDDAERKRSVERLLGKAEEIAHRRGLTIQHSVRLEQPAVQMDQFLTAQIEEAVQKVGCKPHHMSSGAGHDAMILAEKVPAAMIFLRTPGGISHDPAETVLVGDVAKAIECGLHLLNQLADSTEFKPKDAPCIRQN